MAGLLIAVFLARAPLYLSVFPPFEGWDEYQHLAYIVHLDETGTIPVFDQSYVSLALRPLLVALPHSQWGGDQVRQWGALSYADYWSSAAPASAAVRGEPASGADGEEPASGADGGAVLPLIRLYQAQQPPLAYILAMPIWRALHAHPLEAIYAIRAVNLLIVAAALVLFAVALTRLVPAFAPRVAVLALVCVHPLFFQNVARVANDALAVATGLAGISLLALARGHRLLMCGLLAAGCLAASVWSKQTSLTLIPALVLGLPVIGWAHGVSTARVWRVTGIATLAFLLLVAPMWVWNYQRYGTIVTTQDSIELAAQGSVVSALATSLVTLAWAPVIDTFLVPGRPWLGGWSFLPVHAGLASVYGWYWGILLATAAIGAALAVRRGGPSIERASSNLRADEGAVGGLAVCAAVVIFTTLGITYHVVLSNSVFGGPMTVPWYFMTALPCLFVLLVRALEAIDARLATVAAAALAVLFVAIDLHGTWVQMPRHYASTSDTALQWARLTAIHPEILSGDFRWLFLTIQLGAVCLVVGGLVHVWRHRGA